MPSARTRKRRALVTQRASIKEVMKFRSAYAALKRAAVAFVERRVAALTPIVTISASKPSLAPAE